MLEPVKEAFILVSLVRHSKNVIMGRMHPALFLDRDGVIIENRQHYVRSWEDVEIFDQALGALARAALTPYQIVIVTNQSAVGRGIISIETAEDINRRLIQEIEKAGGRIDGVFLCPHAPQEHCTCRKPQPGLILQAAQALSIDLDRSILVGDALSDLQAGLAAGVGKVALVRTGRGAKEARSPDTARMAPFPTFDSLASALAVLLPQPSANPQSPLV
jgi:D-glycero-D-manno-heptose 1,7-bisphosphate phosphatase